MLFGKEHQVLELLRVGSEDPLASNHVCAGSAILLRLFAVPPVATSHRLAGIGCGIINSRAQPDAGVRTHGRKVRHQQGASRNLLARVDDTVTALKNPRVRGIHT